MAGLYVKCILPAEQEILIAINRAQSAATKAGALGDARSLLINVGLVRDGYRASLERMATLLIGLDANTDPSAIAVFQTAAANFAESVSTKKPGALFGAPAFDPRARERAAVGLPALGAELCEIANAVIADARNRIVGHNVIARPAAGVSSQILSLIAALELLKLTEADTSILAGISHQQLIEKVKQFVNHHGDSATWGSSVTTTQGLGDSGTDVIVDAPSRFGLQVKCNADFTRTKGGDTIRRTILAQIQESRRQKLCHLMLMLAADLTSQSVREKCRGLLAELHSTDDPYVIVIEPETMAELVRWRKPEV